MGSKSDTSQRLVMSVFPHIEDFTKNFNDWVYYITFGYNIHLDHFIDKRGRSYKNRIDYITSNKENIVKDVKKIAGEFEKTCLNDIRKILGSGITTDFSQFFSADGESMSMKLSSIASNKIGQLKYSNEEITKEKYEKMIATRAIIFGVPINISEKYNIAFKNPASVRVFNKAHTKKIKKTLILYTLSESINNYEPSVFCDKLFNNFNKKKDILSIRYDDLKWDNFKSLVDKIGNTCRSYFGSTDYSVSYSNLNKYGYSATPHSFIELVEN